MRMRTRLAALLLSGAVLAVCGGCAVTEPLPELTPSPGVSTSPVLPEDELDFALGYAAGDTLHPLEAEDRSNLDVASLVYEGLYEADGTFAPRPVLAQSAEMREDGLVWTVTLREDAAFSDGTPLEAAHVVSSLRTAMKGGSFAPRLREVASVKEKDGRVVITLTVPNGNLPALLTVPIVLEREEGLPLGTGPYVVDGDVDELWLVSNPNWWQGRKPAFDRIPLRAARRLDEKVSAFDGGEVSAVTTDPNAPNALGYSCVYETYDFPTTKMLFVGFRTVDGPCADPLVRAALARAFDRASVVSHFLGGYGGAATLPVSPCSETYPKEIAAGLDYDLTAAEALLTEAGYTRGEDGLLVKKKATLSLRLVVNQDSRVKQRIARFLAEDLRRLGVDVTVDELGWDDYTAALAAGQFDLYLGEVKLTGDFDCGSLLLGALNFGLYGNEEVAALYAAWKAAAGDAREGLGKALYTALAAEVPFAALCFKNDLLLVRWGLLKNPSPVEGNPFAGVEKRSVEK